jgi:hypothetical protein
MGVRSAIAAGTLALALALAPRAAGACTCAAPRPQLLATAPDGTFPAALPMVLVSPPDAFFEIQDAAGAAATIHRLVELPRLGQCETPWFLIAIDEDQVTPGEYRLARAPGDVSPFVRTAGAFTSVSADLTVSLTVETHAPITPNASTCADPKIVDRPYARTAHLSFALAARADAVPMFVTATVPDPKTPEGLADSIVVRPIGPTGPDLLDLPLEDGADPCADVMGFDGAARLVQVDHLCAPNAPETHALHTRVVVPLVEPTGLERENRGCAVATPDRPSSALAILAALAALGIMVCACRRRPRHTSTRTG